MEGTQLGAQSLRQSSQAKIFYEVESRRDHNNIEEIAGVRASFFAKCGKTVKNGNPVASVAYDSVIKVKHHVKVKK